MFLIHKLGVEFVDFFVRQLLLQDDVSLSMRVSLMTYLSFPELPIDTRFNRTSFWMMVMFSKPTGTSYFTFVNVYSMLLVFQMFLARQM